MEFLFYVSLFISVAAFMVGITKLSWIYLLISGLAFLPMTYYFSGANNAWQYAGFIPLFILLLLSLLFALIKKNNEVKNLNDFLKRI